MMMISTFFTLESLLEQFSGLKPMCYLFTHYENNKNGKHHEMIVIFVNDIAVMCKCVQVILYYIIFMRGFPLRELRCHFVNKMHLISKQLYIYKVYIYISIFSFISLFSTVKCVKSTNKGGFLNKNQSELCCCCF